MQYQTLILARYVRDYKPMGHLMVGGQQYSAQSGASGTSLSF